MRDVLAAASGEAGAYFILQATVRYRSLVETVVVVCRITTRVVSALLPRLACLVVTTTTMVVIAAITTVITYVAEGQIRGNS